MKKVIYFHGLSSSGATATARNLRKILCEAEVLSPDIPIGANDALTYLHQYCEREKPDLIMGTSMGGMFAQQMFGYKKIIINPAFHVSTIMRQNIGTIQFLNPRQDGATEYAITPELCEEYEEMEKHQFEGITEYDKTHTFAYFGKNDTLVHGFDEYHQHYQLSDWYAGEHRLRYQDIRDNMMAQIKKMLLEQ